MNKWNLKLGPENNIEKNPSDIFQEFADSLILETNQKLSGKVEENITYDIYDRPKIITTLYIYLPRLKQKYRLFETVQLSEKRYPVNLTAYFYTGSREILEIETANKLEEEIEEIILSGNAISNLINHFISMEELKTEE